MASSKLVTTNPDLPRQSSICSLSTMLADLQQQQQHQQNPSSSSKALGASMSMDDLLKNLYSDQTPNQLPLDGSSSISPQGSFSQPKELGDKTVDDVWKEIVAGNDNQRQAGAEEAGNDAASGQLEEMTLEDFLTKTGVVREEDVRSGAVVPGPGGYGVDSSAAVAMNGGQFALQGVEVGHALVPFDGRVVVGGAVGGGRGKRRAVEEPVVDKATQQRQRRMIKNRESAARSRERKQAYTVELESLVTQLEEEKARLLREEASQNKERFKQLMQNLIPVVEKRRPPRTLRRVNSVHW